MLEYLKSKYKVNQPIFITDINFPISEENLLQMLKELCEKDQIKEYDAGIYYIEGESRLKGGVSLSASEVARCKYIEVDNIVKGYYSGYTFANQLGLTTQVPFTIEIVSNVTNSVYEEVRLKNQKIILRKPRIPVTNENSRVLQLLDLLINMDQYMDNDIDCASERIQYYISERKISREEIDRYIDYYPKKIEKVLYEMGLF